MITGSQFLRRGWLHNWEGGVRGGEGRGGTGVDVLLGSRAETSQATSCHLPLPAQPRQTGPAGVRKSEVDIIIITKKTARTPHHSLLSVVPTMPILQYD